MIKPSLSIVFLSLCICLSAAKSYCSIFPQEGAQLNYRIIGFSFEPLPGTANYTIQITAGRVPEESLFEPQISSVASVTNRVIAEVPDFGANYTWRIVYTIGDSQKKYSELHHFSTGNIPLVNNPSLRLRVTKENAGNSKQYVLVDEMNTMYDMEGKPVWYLPEQNNVHKAGYDMKCTPQHTLTMLWESQGYEINYNGKVLWKSPEVLYIPGKRGKVRVPFHHEFTRLANGHYMILGLDVPSPDNSKKPQKATSSNSSSSINQPGTHHFFPQLTNGSSLYEIDSLGNVVWSWKSDDYFKHSDIDSFIKDVFRKWHMPANGHENSFYFDEQEQAIYLSYAAFNRIIKISYPSGNVLNSYGKTYHHAAGKPIIAATEAPASDKISRMCFKNNLFSGQHSCGKSVGRSLMIYNNNVSSAGSSPEVLLLKEPGKAKGGKLTKVWSFECPIDSSKKYMENGGGGCFSELQDNSLFVSMNYPYGRLFIVTMNKEIVWSAEIERMNQKNEWEPLYAYRASVVSQSALEELIWNGVEVNAAEE